MSDFQDCINKYFFEEFFCTDQFEIPQIIFKRRFRPTKEMYQSKQNLLRALNCKNPLRATLLAFFPVVEITAKRLFITLQGVALL